MFSDVGESLVAAVENLRGYLMRSMLAATGVVIAVASVIAVVSIMQGFSNSIEGAFGRMGADTITVRSFTPLSDQLTGKTNRLTLREYELFRHRIGATASLSPSFAPTGPFGATVTAGPRSSPARIIAATSQYQSINGAWAQTGRFLSEGDDRHRRKVAVIGDGLRRELGLGDDPSGTFVSLNGDWFKIVGAAEPRGDVLGLSQDMFLILPFSVGESLLPSGVEPDVEIALSPAAGESVASLQQRVSEVAVSTFGRDGEDAPYRVDTAGSQLEAFNSLTTAATLIAAGLVGISLLVGGIGIMNIMMVSVRERTREIGVLKALGATRRQILQQFLVEAVLLTTLGGGIGIVAGWAIGLAASAIIPGAPSAEIPLWAIGLALGFSTLTGIVFGVAPAAQAASLDPVEALRFE